eukprot:TRINITY_DN106785_c0_g1_i1.p1 TRINITY_DN106785_c0_g1~~TRINITY_DN106785_c0_g1_i1.p1  ORF type:complete len:475 (+),score=106.95 TRINITY_DN106785_c0_g1_i1:90-1514(+)
MTKKAAEAAKLFVDFANETGSPYHCVSACAKLLRARGFQELADGGKWSLSKGGKYFVTKGGADVMAFVVGGKFSADGDSGMSMLGAHTDSPCLRLRPNSKLSSAGMLQVGVQTYGGGLWYTWFDRPLGFAGKVIMQDASGKIAEKLIRVAKPVMIIPSLAIHLQSPDERKAFSVNTETHIQPILCSKMYDDEAAKESGRGDEAPKDGDSIMSRHHVALLELIAKEVGCKPTDILDADLCLMDAQPSNLVGLYEEFISSPRIDNLLSTWGAIQGICNFGDDAKAVADAKDICVAVSFDHEEVGSQSFTGADGDTLPTWLDRVLGSLDVPALVRPEVYSRSFLLSADCAHGVNPNYAAKHQAEHRPEFHKGIVIKTNANQRYATTPLTAALFREVCKRAEVPVQEFVVRNDSPCGTTIGPIISSKIGVRTIDIGAPQWAMHSCRETCASTDALHMITLSKVFFEQFREIDNSTAKL